MLRVISLVFLLNISFLVCAQTNSLRNSFDSLTVLEDSLTEIESVVIRKDTLSVLKLDEDYLHHLLLQELKDQCRVARRRKNIKESYILNCLSESCSNILSKSKFEKNRKWNKMQKHLYQGVRNQNCSFGIFKSYAFKTDLTDKSLIYHYRRKDTETETHLFYGRKKNLKYNSAGELEENQSMPKPIPHKTYEELVAEIIKTLRKNKLSKYINSGYFTGLGVSVKLDEKSIGGRKYPQAKVVVFLGGQRLARFKESKK